jgi:CRP-like cAMP-binding protein
VDLADCTLLHGLDERQRERVRSRLTERRLAAGEYLFREGEPGDRLYVLTEGSVSVVGGRDAVDTLRQRFVSFSPGMTLGETAMLDGGGRTADGRADTPATVYELPQDALLALQHEDPALAARLYRNLATHLSQRLRNAAANWRRDAD